MNWLLLDTSCPHALVAIVDEKSVLAEQKMLETMQHAEQLTSAIEKCLKEAALTFSDLDGVAVGKGPGSFVGVRIAIAHAKGICVAKRLPLVGLSTLFSIAAEPSLPEGDGIAIIDAKRGEVYAQCFRRTAEGVEVLTPAEAIPLEVFETFAKIQDFVVGFAQSNHITHRREGPSAEGMLQALQVKIKAGIIDELNSLEPDYCRAPDAKKMGAIPGKA